MQIVVPENKFGLNAFNKLLFVAVLIYHLALILRMPEPSSEVIGSLVGSYLGFLIFPTAISWVIWRFLGKKYTLANGVLSCLLVLMLFGNIVRPYFESLPVAERADAQDKINDSLDNFKENIRASNSQEEVNALAKEQAKSLSAGIDKIAETAGEKEKRHLAALKEVVDMTNSKSIRFGEAFAKTKQTNVLDYGSLKNQGAFDSHKKIITEYIESAESCLKAFKNAPRILKEKLGSDVEENGHATGVYQGYRDEISNQIPKIQDMCGKHASTGKQVLKALVYLEKHKESWVFLNDQLVFQDPSLIQEYNSIFEKLIEVENDLNQAIMKYR